MFILTYLSNRLGACEAPPSIMSIYLGESLTEFLEAFRSAKDPSKVAHFQEASKELNMGSSVLAPIRCSPVLSSNLSIIYLFKSCKCANIFL